MTRRRLHMQHGAVSRRLRHGLGRRARAAWFGLLALLIWLRAARHGGSRIGGGARRFAARGGGFRAGGTDQSAACRRTRIGAARGRFRSPRRRGGGGPRRRTAGRCRRPGCGGGGLTAGRGRICAGRVRAGSSAGQILRARRRSDGPRDGRRRARGGRGIFTRRSGDGRGRRLRVRLAGQIGGRRICCGIGSGNRCRHGRFRRGDWRIRHGRDVRGGFRSRRHLQGHIRNPGIGRRGRDHRHLGHRRNGGRGRKISARRGRDDGNGLRHN